MICDLISFNFTNIEHLSIVWIIIYIYVYYIYKVNSIYILVQHYLTSQLGMNTNYTTQLIDNYKTNKSNMC